MAKNAGVGWKRVREGIVLILHGALLLTGADVLIRWAARRREQRWCHHLVGEWLPWWRAPFVLAGGGLVDAPPDWGSGKRVYVTIRRPILRSRRDKKTAAKLGARIARSYRKRRAA